MTIRSRLLQSWRPILLIILLVALVGLFGQSSDAESGSDAVLLQSIPALTFYAGKWTNARRTSAIPQVKCVGGTAQGQFEPKVVQCQNVGSDGRDVQWRCEADMDTSYRFGAIRVSCEGYGHPDDPYILQGSCGLEYELDWTEEGRRRQQQNNYGGGNTFTGGYRYGGTYNNSYGENTAVSFFTLVIVGFIIFVLWRACTAPTVVTGPGGVGGGYYGGPDFGGGPGPGGPGGPYYGGGCAPPPVYAAPVQPGGGFWTGMATGGLLGYMFNRPRYGYGGGYYGGGGYHAPTYTMGAPSFGGGGSGGGGGGGGSTRTATGFGGTTRR
jgi:hypothetical protein